MKLSTPSSPTIAQATRATSAQATGQAAVPEATPEPVKLSATLRAEVMAPLGSQLMRANKNRCLKVAGVELYLGKLLSSTMVKDIWDHEELMVVSMDGELVTKYDFPCPDRGTYSGLQHAKVMFQNVTERG